jgi:uncharacterized C2H2 Zn-finger protein
MKNSHDALGGIENGVKIGLNIFELHEHDAISIQRIDGKEVVTCACTQVFDDEHPWRSHAEHQLTEINEIIKRLKKQ